MTHAQCTVHRDKVPERLRLLCAVLLWLFQLVSVLWLTPACRADGPVLDTPANGQSVGTFKLTVERLPKNCFGDSPVSCRFTVSGPSAVGLRFDWDLNVDRLSVQSGSSRLNVVPGTPETVLVEFKTPTVSPGVIVSAVLDVRVRDDSGAAVLSRRFPIRVFHSNPFDITYSRIKELAIEFVDPDKSLTPLVRELGVVDYREKKLKSWSDADVVVIAPMKRRPPNMNGKIEEVMSSGGRILFLAPESEKLTVVNTSESNSAPAVNAMYGARDDFGPHLDRRLSVSGLRSTSVFHAQFNRQGGLDILVQPNSNGWTYLESCFVPPDEADVREPLTISDRYDAAPRFICCSLDLVESWEASPSPRYLVAMMLDRLVPRSSNRLKESAGTGSPSNQ